MDWDELAPWIAIVFTATLSIIVPLFTQIINNRFQLKMKKIQLEEEEKKNKDKAKMDAFESFLRDVGKCTYHIEGETLGEAEASINRMYLYAPVEWRSDLKIISNYLGEYKYELVRFHLEELAAKIADYNKE